MSPRSGGADSAGQESCTLAAGATRELGAKAGQPCQTLVWDRGSRGWGAGGGGRGEGGETGGSLRHSDPGDINPPNAHLPSFRGSRKHSPSLFSCFPCSVSPIYVLLFSPFYSSCHKKTHNHTAEQANWMFVEILIAGYCRPKI